MSLRPVMDAGPGINFLSVNKERLLFSALGPCASRKLWRLRSSAKQAKISDSPQQNVCGRSSRSASWKSFPTT